jgi:hypothetical protein
MTAKQTRVLGYGLLALLGLVISGIIGLGTVEMIFPIGTFIIGLLIGYLYDA